MMVFSVNQLLHIIQSFEEMDPTTAGLKKEHEAFTKGKYCVLFLDGEILTDSILGHLY